MDDFLIKFGEAIEIEDPQALTPETEFKNLDDWNSMAVLLTIAMADEEYDVEIDGNDIRKAITLKDLYNLIQGKKA